MQGLDEFSTTEAALAQMAGSTGAIDMSLLARDRVRMSCGSMRRSAARSAAPCAAPPRPTAHCHDTHHTTKGPNGWRISKPKHRSSA